MSTARDWIQAARPLAQANLAAPLLLGQALAFQLTGRFEWTRLFAIFAWGVLDQLTIVFANDYADREGDQTRTLFSGGSGVIPEGKIAPTALRRAALACAALLLCGSAAMSAWLRLAPLLGVVALLLLQAYSFAPLRLSYRGHGEWLQGLGIGGVLPLLGFGIQAGTLAAFPWAVLAGTVLLATAGNVATALPDVADDRRAKKRTWPVRRGVTRAAWACLALTVGALWMMALAATGPARVVVAFAALPLLLAVRATPRSRTQCVRFVFLHGACTQLALLGWALASATGR